MNMSMIKWIVSRGVSTSNFRYGKRNLGKLLLFNKRGTKLFKKEQSIEPDPDVRIDNRGVRATGFNKEEHFTEIKEMIPELIVPNLNNFLLKPYVSYKSEIINQSKFTSKNLFDFIYKKKIIQDFKNNKLDSSGKPLEPSFEEKLTLKNARRFASKPGSDIFTCKISPLGKLIPSDPK